MKTKGSKNLTYVDRLWIENCLKSKIKVKDIAIKLDLHISAIYKESKRGEYLKLDNEIFHEHLKLLKII